MSRVQTPFTYCRGCQAKIVWTKHDRSGKPCPVNFDGSARNGDTFNASLHTPHWKTCPKASEFRKPKEPARAVAAPKERGAPKLWVITLPQPWAWAISWARCDFAPCLMDRARVGDWIAIHVDRHATDRWLRREMAEQPPMRDALPVGHIAVVGEMVRRVEEGVSQDPWHRGMAGYVLRKQLVIHGVDVDEDVQPGTMWLAGDWLRDRVRAAAKRAQEQRR